MGFDPGDFTDRDGNRFHWEIKGGGRVVLWNHNESEKLLDLTYDQAERACRLLETALSTQEPVAGQA